MVDYQRDIWHKTAIALNWKWSNAHDGYINENYRGRIGEDPSNYGSYEVAADAEQACFWDGVETIEQALNKLELR